MSERQSHFAARLSQLNNENSAKSLSPDRRSSQVVDRTSIRSLRMSVIAARGSLLTSTRQSRSSLLPPSAGKAKQRREAKTMQKIILDQAKHLGQPPPQYEFLEFIGKGTFGKVYKWYVESPLLLCFFAFAVMHT